MSLPSDILLPENAKFFGFVDSKLAYNSNYDITWSFQFSIIGEDHGFCTFLTTNPTISSGVPGQYLGYLNTASYLLTEDGQFVLTEDGQKIILSDLSANSIEVAGVMAIAFDSSGLFALSGENFPGVGINDIKRDSIIIRDNDSNVIFYEHLSALDSNFVLSSEDKYEQILRFRYSNGNKISIDYRTPSTKFITLTTVNISFNIEAYDILYPGFTFCSPISSEESPSTLFLKNFHTQGNTSPPTITTTVFTPLTSTRGNTYTTLNGVSAYRINS